MAIPGKCKRNVSSPRGARRTLFAIVVALATLAGGCGQVSHTAEDHLERGQQFERQGDLAAASIEYRNALQRDPSNAEGRYRLGVLMLELGDPAGAETELNRAREFGKDVDALRLPLLQALLDQQKYARVRDETRLIESFPESQVPQALAFRGFALLGMENPMEAEPLFGEALDLDVELVNAQIGMAITALVIHRDPGAAREWLDKALGLDPKAVRAWSLLGDLEQALGHLEEAEQAFGKAIEHQRRVTVDRVKRAVVRIQLGRFDEAKTDIGTLKRQGLGGHPYVNYAEGLLHFSKGDLAEAAAAFEASYTAHSSFLPNRLYLATTRLLLGHTERARRHAQWLYASVPNSQEVSRLLGMVRMNNQEFAEAREALQAALRNSPEDRITLGMLTTVSLLQGDAVQGAEYAGRLAALEPESEPVRNILMMARLMAGQPLDDRGTEAGINGAMPTGTDEYQREFLRALEAFRDNRPDTALEQARRLHEQYPDRVDPLNLMAASYLAMGQWDRGKVELEKVLELQPNNLAAMRNLAKVEMRIGEPRRARELLQALLQDRPGDEELALLLALAEVRLDDRPAGIRTLEQVVENNPDAHTARARLAGEHLHDGNYDRILELTQRLNDAQMRAEPALLELRGKAQMQQGDAAAARESFERWTRFAPDSAEAHFLYGDTLARSGEVALARRQLVRAIELDPDYLPARVGQIRMLVQLDEVDRARDALSRLKEDFGDQVEVLGIEGWFALTNGDFATAERSLAAVWEQRPDSEVTVLLFRALWGQGKHDQALAFMHDWLEHQPQDIAVLLHLAGGYLGLDRDNEAVEVYKRVVDIHPNHVPALNNIAWLSRDDDLGRAVEYAERAFALAPEDPYVLDTLGMLKLQQGQVATAYELIRAAAERSSEAQIHLHLGSILVQQQRFDEAREILEALATEVPESEPGREAKVLLQSIPAQ